MINVSTAWANASREMLLPEMLVELTYQVTDPGIHEEAIVSGVNVNSASKISNLLVDRDSRETRYGTLGWNNWGLDGSYRFYGPEYLRESFLGKHYSRADQNTWASGTEPQIVINFPSVRDTVLPGLRITWSPKFNEWATSFKITTYRGNTLVAEKTVENNTSVSSTVDFSMSGYNKIVITILAWSIPHGLARCTGVYLGGESVFMKDDLLGYTHSQSSDLLSATLPKNTITFRLRNEKSQWNPDNLEGQAQFLTDQQEIKVRYGMVLPGGVEWIDGGVFWLSEWDVPSNGMEASFTARDLLTFMSESYTGPQSGTLYDIAEAALQQTYLPSLSTGASSYELDLVLKEYTTTFTGVYSIAEVLQMIAHAGNCVMYQDRQGTLRISSWSARYSGYIIDQTISYTHPEYSISRPLKNVSVGYEGDLRVVIPYSSTGEVQTIDNELLVTQMDATRVGEKAIEILSNRKVISGEFRADMRLDCLDSVIITSKYASNIIALTDVEYSTSGGAFRGRYTGRVVSVKLESASYYVGELYVGEV